MADKISVSALEGVPAHTGIAADLQRQRQGLPSILAAYIIWAALPIYWKQLGNIPAFEILCHRSLWGCILVCLAMWAKGSFKDLKASIKNRRALRLMLACSALHTFSWFFFIWSVSAGYLLELSLGNYILPLLSVVAGFVVFKERPRRMQWVAIALAACGVFGTIAYYGHLPWVAFVSAASPVLFAIVRKKAPVDAIPGMVMELFISGPFLWACLIWLHATGQGHMGSADLSADLWLVGAGIFTVVPQVAYAYGLTRIPLTTLSLLQYLPPTGYFLIGTFLHNEPLTEARLVAFVFIWLGLILFTLEGYRYHRRFAQHATSETR